MIGIYLITSPSGRAYIGQTRNFKRRIKNYRNLRNSGQPLLFNSFNKYGFDSHEIKIIHELPVDVTQDVLNKYEEYYLDAYRSAGFRMMNVRGAGSNGAISESTKKKISIANTGKLKGVKQSEDHKRKRSLSMLGKTIWLGKKHKEESKIKTRNALMGVEKSPDHKLKCIENFRKATQARIKPVIQLTKDGVFIKEWSSAKDVELSGIALARSICHACKGRYHTANGFKWEYKNKAA